MMKKYPKFIYEKYDYRIVKNDLELSFKFKILPDISFEPFLRIKNINKSRFKAIDRKAIDNLVFHLGLMEIPSYWKATCSPIIEIKAGFLDNNQIKWWKDLIMNGMGQFFYENKIDRRKPNFLKIICSGEKKEIFSGKLKNKFLIPVGGGRDSIVTLEKFKNKEINCFLLNPKKPAKDVIKIAGIKKPIIVDRKIDPTLLKLNRKGYLNGHTPFTALLSFLTVFCAVLFDYKNVVFSNEKSASEGNLKYLGKIINHQYSKSLSFEKKFKLYLKKYLAKDVNYFSFLRQYSELEISKMFLEYPQYFSAFSSCNSSKKWCCNCPKCLFVYTTLYPFLEKKELLEIFGKDMFEDKKLLPIMEGLIGKKSKPFECVGTFAETRKAVALSQKKAKNNLPYILRKICLKN